MTIDATGMHFQDLCRRVKEAGREPVKVVNCTGQRYIGSGTQGADITIEGTPGNALGAYLDGGRILVRGNAQDATGDTMNDGEIVIHGSSGDATGYAMRGGRIFVRDSAAYRAGIHMKAYRDKVPALVIGGRAGSFLGEYQAGGVILVLGLDGGGAPLVGDFCGTGMHGGKIFLRCQEPPANLPPQVAVRKADQEDMAEIIPLIREYSSHFGVKEDIIGKSGFLCLLPNSNNPYRQLYVHN